MKKKVGSVSVRSHHVDRQMHGKEVTQPFMARVAVLSLVALLTIAGTTSVSYADKLSDAKAQQQNLQKQQQTTKTQIATLQAKENALRQQITDIESQISTLQTSIYQTSADIQRRNEQIALLQKKIQQTEVQIQQQYVVLQQRMRVIYENGTTSYMDVLFTSTSFTDLLDRLQFLSLIAEQDKKVLTGIQTSKQELDASNSQLKQQLDAQKVVYQTLQNKKSAQERAQTTEQTLFSQVHDSKLKQQAALQSENAAMANLKSLISQLEAQEGTYTGPAGGWTWPVPAAHNISSGYGWRTWPDGSKEFHNGIDIPASIGTPIVAATSGKVLFAGPASGFGDWVVIESTGGLIEIYGHMFPWEIKVSPGQDVRTGQQIAAVGNNGESTGPHLHFTIATGFDSAGFAISVDPMKYV